MDQTLQATIEQMYTVFSGYPLPEHVSMSSLRDPEKELGIVRQSPLRLVPASGMEAYAFHAITTVGDEALLRYTLPRLLELLAHRELVVDEAIVLGKLELAGWRTWPEAEREAIGDFFDAWWVSVLRTPVDVPDWRTENILCGLAQTNLSLSRFLVAWETAAERTATDHLASIVNALYDSERGEFITENFWDDRPGQGAQVRIWLTRPEILARLKKGVQNAQNDEELVGSYDQAIAALRVVLHVWEPSR